MKKPAPDSLVGPKPIRRLEIHELPGRQLVNNSFYSINANLWMLQNKKTFQTRIPWQEIWQNKNHTSQWVVLHLQNRKEKHECPTWWLIPSGLNNSHHARITTHWSHPCEPLWCHNLSGLGYLKRAPNTNLKCFQQKNISKNACQTISWATPLDV